MHRFLRSFPAQLLFCLGSALLLMRLASWPAEIRPQRTRVPLVRYVGEADDDGAPARRVRLKRLHPANIVKLVASPREGRP